MPQLPLFEDATQTHPPTRSIARPKSLRSPRPKRPPQSPLLAPPAATAPAIPAPIAPIDRPIAIAPPPAKELPPGWVDPANPAFNYLKNCRLCGALIKTGGLDHSLCSGECGWVIDLTWQARQQHRKRKEPEPHAATHTDSRESETLDLFSDGLDRDSATRRRAAASDRDTSEMDGGAA